jgi:threonyl-tRNA synthetase
MRTLLFHCRNYRVKIDRLANRPENISPEEVKEKDQALEDCVVALITIEKGDNLKVNCDKLVKEIEIMCKEVSHNKVVVLPFAHLSNNLANSNDGIKAMGLVENELRKKFEVLRAHFGSHKSLLLDIYGHPGNARYREFYD